MKVKICGLSRPSDIAAVNQYRPDYAGFIIKYPKSHRSCTPEQVQALHAQLSPDIPAVGVTVNQPLDTVASLLEQGIIDIAQLHGQEDDAYIQALQARTGKPIWKAFRIRSTDDLDAARASSADMILLDNGYGTGETFDWTLVRDIGRPDKRPARGIYTGCRCYAAGCNGYFQRRGDKSCQGSRKNPRPDQHHKEYITCQKEDSAFTADNTSPKL